MRRPSKAPGVQWTGRVTPVLLVALLVAPFLATGAGALAIGDIEPLYFGGIGGAGFALGDVSAAGLAPSFSATPADDWIAAGAAQFGTPIRIDQALGTFHQLPALPTPGGPIIVDSTWTVTNVSAGSLTAPLLVFLDVDPDDTFALLPPTGLDADLLELLSYSFGGDDFVFGVAVLPDLAQGESAEITVRYVIGGPLPIGLNPPLPPLGVAALNSYEVVPEPSTALLLGLGLGVLGICRRRGCGREDAACGARSRS